MEIRHKHGICQVIHDTRCCGCQQFCSALCLYKNMEP